LIFYDIWECPWTLRVNLGMCRHPRLGQVYNAGEVGGSVNDAAHHWMYFIAMYCSLLCGIKTWKVLVNVNKHVLIHMRGFNHEYNMLCIYLRRVSKKWFSAALHCISHGAKGHNFKK
jgi:hypothetical protein